MTTVIFIVSVALAISLGTVGSYILLMKLITSKRGKQAMLDYSKELTDITYELVKVNLSNTKKWQELIELATFDNE